MSALDIHFPLFSEQAKQLTIGTVVHLYGTLLVARDAAHKRLVECIENNQPLPVDLRNQCIYYLGPSPARPTACIGAAGPTTSGRMDPYSPTLIHHGITAMLGKGSRSAAVHEAMQQYGAVHLAATGGAGALLAQCITSYTVIAWAELGAEALAQITVEKFPAIVAGDAHGNDLYKTGRQQWASSSE